MRNTKRMVLLGGFLLLFGTLAFILYQRNSPESEPVKVYKATTKSVPEKAAPTRATPKLDAHDHAGHNHAAHDPHETHPVLEEINSEDISSVDTEGAEDIDTRVYSPDEFAAESPMSAPTAEEMTEQEAVAWLNEQFERLNAQLAENYPELIEIPHLTPEELDTLYPTPEARDALRELALQARAEFFEEFRKLFAEVPTGVMEIALSESRKIFTQSWGAEAADTVIAEIRAEMGL